VHCKDLSKKNVCFTYCFSSSAFPRCFRGKTESPFPSCLSVARGYGLWLFATFISRKKDMGCNFSLLRQKICFLLHHGFYDCHHRRSSVKKSKSVDYYWSRPGNKKMCTTMYKEKSSIHSGTSGTEITAI
jgi:hypothetical protein